MTPEQKTRLRELPAVGTLLEDERVLEWIEGTSRPAVLGALQEALEAARRRITDDTDNVGTDMETVLAAARERLEARCAPSLVRVINATGIALHTGLGRAPLAPSAVEAIARTAGGYCNLEYDLAGGGRGRRQAHVASLITRLTGAEAATVVNNNAAATLLILSTLAADREVIVSRGQLIEIGGSFRLPEIMKAGQAILCEVGTTNRTRIEDYAAAITDRTAVLMNVHPSNYRVVGFTEAATIGQLAELAHRFGLLAVDDLGSGALFDLTQIGLPAEPVVGDSVAAGADLVCFSGDKLLGGPQCGIICGRRTAIERLEAHPLMRTYRVGKLTLLALEATLRYYDDPQQAARSVPTLAMLSAKSEHLAQGADALQAKLSAALPEESFLVCSDVGYAGGGSLPAETLETVVVQWRPRTATPETITAGLRAASPPVIVRIQDQAVLFDLRTIDPDDFDAIVAAACEATRD
ncbi:MAG: L-seryl-tRNA(Sec) selenium transferase [Planctomycetes bacterium]|nr:L-seryl-tRNA(Sec) selenium transferase [Planctomycetota bacterium]